MDEADPEHRPAAVGARLGVADHLVLRWGAVGYGLVPRRPDAFAGSQWTDVTLLAVCLFITTCARSSRSAWATAGPRAAGSPLVDVAVFSVAAGWTAATSPRGSSA